MKSSLFSKQNIKIFLPPNRDSLNDATQYYVELIERAIKKSGGSTVRCKYLKEINRGDTVLTIELFPFVQVFLLKGAKVIHWVQGVSPEEARLNKPGRLFYYARCLMEMFVLRFSKWLFLVSNAMLKHYEKKYPVSIAKKAIIIPCYNKHLLKEPFFVENRYKTPTFVYAGSLSKWQCFEEMIAIYKGVQEKIENCKLTVLTAETEKANHILRQNELKNFEVKYVPLAELERELSKHKYGFLIRKHDVINYVATPTKMNSYLAVGLLPIFTDAVGDFNEKINLQTYELKLSGNIDVEQAVKAIVDFEKNTTIDPDGYYRLVKNLFDDYYSDDKNIHLITTKQ
ncbi:hypothetical protein [Capnocytophaga sp.]|uniref:hypothetical protein n=1 Tax=Capnocytophaga sp. TaxID=44737 RepID=UPI0026DC9D3A|nr:hypothetical protein [Capnocytophaga sp.]MDO5104288.1 hypothetical protein [Capnocytophaga sp.]